MSYELPRHGADGIYGDETTAAAMRLQIDAGHPWPAGQDWEHIGGIAGPNTMAHFDMFDPGGTVGSHAPAVTGVTAASARFAESPDNLFAGFDASTSPSLVVGAKTRRRLRVDVEPFGSDVDFDVLDPLVATVGRTHEGIVVGGERPGETVVRALAGGVAIAELAVVVKVAREEVVNFHYVSSSGRPALRTTRGHDKATLLTLRLNRVFRRQANVHFTLGQIRDVVVAEMTDSALERFVSPGQLDVFCVPHAAAGSAFVLLADDDSSDGMDLPHAVARLLGGTGPADGLLAGCGEGVDRRRISRALADSLNP